MKLKELLEQIEAEKLTESEEVGELLLEGLFPNIKPEAKETREAAEKLITLQKGINADKNGTSKIILSGLIRAFSAMVSDVKPNVNFQIFPEIENTIKSKELEVFHKPETKLPKDVYDIFTKAGCQFEVLSTLKAGSFDKMIKTLKGAKGLLEKIADAILVGLKMCKAEEQPEVAPQTF